MHKAVAPLLSPFLCLMLAGCASPQAGDAEPLNGGCDELGARLQAQLNQPVRGTKGFHNLDVALVIGRETPAITYAVEALIAESSRHPIKPGGPVGVPAPPSRKASDANRTHLAPVVDATAKNRSAASPKPGGTYRSGPAADGARLASPERASGTKLAESPPWAGAFGDRKSATAQLQQPARRRAPALLPSCERLEQVLATAKPPGRKDAVARARSAVVDEYRETLRRRLKVTDVLGCEEFAAKASEHYVMAGGDTNQVASGTFIRYYQRCLAKATPAAPSRTLATPKSQLKQP